MAVLIKEFIQMKRDRPTFSMIVAIPIMQLILFGYAINSNPKYLPTVVVNGDHSSFTRTFLQGLKHTDYFRFVQMNATEKQAEKMLATDRAKFVLNIPTDFSREFVRGNRPSILLTIDATDPMAASNAMASANVFSNSVFDRDINGALSYLKPKLPPFQLEVHTKFNPEFITYYNIVPGLIGVVLTMTLVIITALVMTRERERGTMENLLAMPVRPVEVMLGKILPYVIVGYLQLFLILFAALYVFAIPFQGSIFLLLLTTLPFILANLSVGLMFSTAAKNQLQATQMAVFFFLPSILLSGFMFPFYGMPMWAQWLGDALPLTYYLRITRGIILKGNDLAYTWPNVWPIIIFMVIALAIGLTRYRRTLD
jgi:ABC-2 type transport system permease protein